MNILKTNLMPLHLFLITFLLISSFRSYSQFEVKQIPITDLTPEDTLYRKHTISEEVIFYEAIATPEDYDINPNFYQENKISSHFRLNNTRVDVSSILPDFVSGLNWYIGEEALYIRDENREYILLTISFISGSSYTLPTYNLCINLSDYSIQKL